LKLARNLVNLRVGLYRYGYAI